MPIEHQTFVKIVKSTDEKEFTEAFTEALASIDKQVNAFLAKQHFSQARDAFQTILPINAECLSLGLMISRTIVYTTEQVSFVPSRPPV
jgi:hypothetical protein